MPGTTARRPLCDSPGREWRAKACAHAAVPRPRVRRVHDVLGPGRCRGVGRSPALDLRRGGGAWLRAQRSHHGTAVGGACTRTGAAGPVTGPCLRGHRPRPAGRYAWPAACPHMARRGQAAGVHGHGRLAWLGQGRRGRRVRRPSVLGRARARLCGRAGAREGPGRLCGGHGPGTRQDDAAGGLGACCSGAHTPWPRWPRARASWP